jgi:hypothetical protein
VNTTLIALTIYRYLILRIRGLVPEIVRHGSRFAHRWGREYVGNTWISHPSHSHSQTCRSSNAFTPSAVYKCARFLLDGSSETLGPANRGFFAQRPTPSSCHCVREAGSQVSDHIERQGYIGFKGRLAFQSYKRNAENRLSRSLSTWIPLPNLSTSVLRRGYCFDREYTVALSRSRIWCRLMGSALENPFGSPLTSLTPPDQVL